jgi:hypothetical protein
LTGIFSPMKKSSIDYPGVGQAPNLFHSYSRQHMI